MKKNIFDSYSNFYNFSNDYQIRMIRIKIICSKIKRDQEISSNSDLNYIFIKKIQPF